MAFNITDSFSRQFNDNMEHIAIQLSSKLRKAVMEERVTGKDFSAERVTDPNDTMAIINSRHADTVISDMDHSRRIGRLVSYARAVMVDDEDKIRMLADPTSPYLKELAGQYNRTIDDLIIEKLLGDALAGETGSTTVALPAAQQIAHGSAGLTLDKLKTAYKILMGNDVDVDGERLYVAVNAAGWDDLLRDSGVTSFDFVEKKVNMDGKLPMLAGFEIIHCERLTRYAGTSAATTNRPAIAFTGSALKLGVGQDMSLDVSRRADKNNNFQLLLKATHGAVRVHDEHVVDIRFQE